jgi:hypothetical protein
MRQTADAGATIGAALRQVGWRVADSVRKE